MPGLLQSPEGNFNSAKVIYALIAEFLGTMLFTFVGTTTPIGTATTEEGMTGSGQTSANWQPWGNGMALAIMGTQTLPACVRPACLIYSFFCFCPSMLYIHQSWLCSFHHCKHLWRAPQSRGHFGNPVHGTHGFCEGASIHPCPDLWGCFWNPHGGKCTASAANMAVDACSSAPLM